jgi:hypothetical protein
VIAAAMSGGKYPTSNHRRKPSPVHRWLNHPAFLIRSRSFSNAGISFFNSFHCSVVQYQ